MKTTARSLGLLALTLAALILPGFVQAAGPGCATSAEEAVNQNPGVRMAESALEARGLTNVSERVEQVYYFAVPQPPFVYGYFVSTWADSRGRSSGNEMTLSAEVTNTCTGYRVTRIDLQRSSGR